MAFIPDDVIPLMRERKLSPNARLVYEAHCKFRRHKYRASFATNQEIADYLGIPLGSVRNATTELTRKGWIGQVAHYTEMLVGDFSEVDKNHPRREIPAGPLFRRPARGGAPGDHETVNGNHETVNPNHGSVNSNHETMISNHETVNGNHGSVNSHIEERARVSSQHQPLPAHTPARPALALVPPAAGEKGCVCGLTVSLELLRRYARNQPQPLGEGWVGKAFDECFRHAQIAEWLGKQSAPAQKPPEMLDVKNCPDCSGGGYYYPEGLSKGVKRCPHAGLYAQMAEAVQARAHAPP